MIGGSDILWRRDWDSLTPGMRILLSRPGCDEVVMTVALPMSKADGDAFAVIHDPDGEAMYG